MAEVTVLTTKVEETTTAAETTKQAPENEEITWGDFDLDDDTTDTDSGNNTDDKGGAATTETVEKEDKPKEWWQIASEKLGEEADSEEKFLEKIKTKEVKEVVVSEADPDIRRLSGYLKLDDEKLVREDKKARGWSKEKIDSYMKKKADDIEFEAEDIRASLNNSIISRQNDIRSAEENRQKAQKEGVLKLHNETKKYLSTTEEVLGFKVGRDEQSTTKWRQGMEKYLTGNGIFKDIEAIVKDAAEGKPEKFVELAQFIKAKDGIAKGLMQKGKSQEAKKFLEDLANSKEEKGVSGERAETGKKEQNLDNWVI